MSPRLRPEPVEGAADTLTLGEATFDAGTGALLRIGDLAVGAPEITLWRAPTENDSLSTGGSYELGDAVPVVAETAYPDPVPAKGRLGQAPRISMLTGEDARVVEAAPGRVGAAATISGAWRKRAAFR